MSGDDHQVVEDFFSIAHRMRQRFVEVVSALDLNETQMHLMEVLAHGDRAMRSMAAALSCDPSNVTLVVDRLEEAGYVERRRSTVDRRVVDLHLTEQGHELLAQRNETLYRDVPLFGGLDDEERRTLGKLLRKVVQSTDAPSS